MIDMLTDFYDLSLHLRGAVLGIVTTSFLAWAYADVLPLKFAFIIMFEGTIITTLFLLVLLWLKI